MKNTQCDKCGLNAPTYYRIEFYKNKDEDRIALASTANKSFDAVPCIENGFHVMEFCEMCFNGFMSDFNTRRDAWKKGT